jgi:hypothetical protein
VRRAVVLLAAVALVAPVAATGDQAWSWKTPSKVLGIERSKRTDFLVRLDGRSLERSSSRLSLGGFTYAWSFSPDGRWLAVGVDRVHGFRIVDVRRLRNVAHVQTWSAAISTLAWLTPRRIIGVEPAGLFIVDSLTRKHLRPPEVAGSIQTVERVGNRLVLILAPDREIGFARLAVIDALGGLKTVQLDRIRAGVRPEIEGRHGEIRWPGLTFDPAGRAFVVGTRDEPVAEIDLGTMEVTYHEPTRSRSFLSRFRNWLEPQAEAKLPLTGSFRTALWLGDGHIAVWGWDSALAGGNRVDERPAGLSILETSDWTTRMVDPDAWHAAFSGGRLLATHGATGGLTAYTTAGEQLYQAFTGQNVGVVATFGSRAYIAPNRGLIRVIDVRSGRIIDARRDLPRVLHPDFTWW